MRGLGRTNPHHLKVKLIHCLQRSGFGVWKASLTILKFPDEEKVSCSTFIFQMDARHWWDSMKTITDVSRLTWEQSKEIFYRKYLSEAYRMAKAEDFSTLKQGSLSVYDYIGNLKSYLTLPHDWCVQMS